jgi:dehydrogenase/reductase SDR family protein 7
VYVHSLSLFRALSFFSPSSLIHAQLLDFSESKVDVLINNAGKSQRAVFHEIELSVDRQLFDINVFGLIHLTRLVVRHWYDRGIAGQLLVTSSTAGKLGVPYSASYTASKHALHVSRSKLALKSVNP